MKDLRIVVMGTPDFAVQTLKTILEHNYNVVGVNSTTQFVINVGKP